MAKQDTWLKNQLPNIRDNLTAVKGVDFLHISMDSNLKKMQPRIGDRQMKMEDRTIPRICGANTIMGCVYGFAVMHYQVMSIKDNPEKKWNGIFTIYRIPAPIVFQPSTKLVPDAKVTGELWICPFAPEYYELNTERVGKIILVHATDEIVCGAPVHNNTFYVKLDIDARLDSELMPPNFYRFDVEGRLGEFGDEKIQRIKNLTTIDAAKWNAAEKQSINNYKQRMGG